MDSVIASSWNSSPTMPGMSRMGRNTAISDRLMDITVNPTSALPRSAASLGGMPSSMCRMMFSSTTMASSTTKPVPMVRAMSERLSMLYPSRYMGPKLPTMDSGSATAGISTARGERRNTKTTPITSRTAMNRVRSVSDTEALTDSERSSTRARRMSPARLACTTGSTARICAAVLTMLLPGMG